MLLVLHGASWGSQGTIVFAPTIAELSAGAVGRGGTPQPLTPILEKGEIGHRWPEFLPGGKAVLFAAANLPVIGPTAQVASSRSRRASGGT